MKNLKEFINENRFNENRFNEARAKTKWDIDDNIDNQNEDFIKNTIIKFLNNNYNIQERNTGGHLVDINNNLDKYLEFIKNGNKYTINSKARIVIETNPDIKELTNELFEWGELFCADPDEHTDDSEFIISSDELISLKGAPKGVDIFTYNDGNLQSFEGAPQKMQVFNVIGNIKSFKGLPDDIKSIVISDNKNLTDFRGMPKNVKVLNCKNMTKLTNLTGVPATLTSAIFKNCKKLSSLKGLPKIEMEEVWLEKCPLITSLKGAPEKVTEWFYCEKCNITNLIGFPRIVGRFDIKSCQRLTSIKGAPEEADYGWVHLCHRLKVTREDFPTKVEQFIGLENNYKK